MQIETNIRSIVKTLSWRFIATVATMILVYIFVGKIEVAATVGGLEVIFKLLLYYFHERLWNKIPIGKKNIEPFVIWFTGLSGAGKSTLAEMLYAYFVKKKFKVECLDGDAVRAIFTNIGFSKEERNEHVKKIGALASILERNGTIVISSFVSPYKESRDYIRKICTNFIEIYVSTSISECEKRDVKGLYKKAREGEILNFTGVSDPYEIPENPELIINTEGKTPHESLMEIILYLKKYTKTGF